MENYGNIFIKDLNIS